MSFSRMDHRDIFTGKGSLKILILFLYVVLCQANPVSRNVHCSFNACTFRPGMCQNGGTCRPDAECQAVCDCLPDFTGKRCETLENSNVSCANTCTMDVCNWHGFCSQDPFTCNITCSCSDGFAGDDCSEETAVDECYPLDCVHGRCIRSEANTVMCHCEEKWTGDTCNIPCNRNCSHGECISISGEEICQCRDQYTQSSNCTEEDEPIEIKNHDATLRLPFLIFICVFPVILLLIFILLIYLMWRKRMIFVMKIIYFLQKYEDEDGKLYDAFISFRSSKDDEFWVLNTLFPMLENEMGFKLCVHFRDFMAGETISNNIIDAIEKSRRTILVISPDYVESEWTRMEYQVAQQEMLSLRHKIVPILFRDIDNVKTVDKNLNLILKSITYIKWPTNKKQTDITKFWDKLRLIMPKKHEVKSTLKGGDVINEWSACTKL